MGGFTLLRWCISSLSSVSIVLLSSALTWGASDFASLSWTIAFNHWMTWVTFLLFVCVTDQVCKPPPPPPPHLLPPSSPRPLLRCGSPGVQITMVSSDSKLGTLVAIPPVVWRHTVSVGLIGPVLTDCKRDKIASFICRLCPRRAACAFL